MAIQGLLGYDELRAKLASLEEAREATEQELAILQNRQEHIAELERDKEAVLENYAAVAPERLDSLAPEERRHVYGMMRLRAVQRPDGRVETEMDGVPAPPFSTAENACQILAHTHEATVFTPTHGPDASTRKTKPNLARCPPNEKLPGQNRRRPGQRALALHLLTRQGGWQ